MATKAKSARTSKKSAKTSKANKPKTTKAPSSKVGSSKRVSRTAVGSSKRVSRTASSQPKPAKSGSSSQRGKGITYRGEHFEGYNKPKLTPNHPSKKAAVLAKDGDTVKLIRFGAQGYGHNYSEEARKSYLARSKGLKGANDKLSANYWARKFLWAGKGGSKKLPEAA